MRSLLADLCFWFATPAKPPSAFAWFRQRGHSMRAPVLAQIDSSEMRGSDDEEASRVVRAGTHAHGGPGLGVRLGGRVAVGVVLRACWRVSENPPLGG